MTVNNTICYETVRCKLKWKYKSFLNNDFEIIDVIDVEREMNYCFDSTQYIMAFINMLKHKVIRLLPDLNKVQISIGIFDKNNVLHRLMVGAYCIICNILHLWTFKLPIYLSYFCLRQKC
jgi:hypothetical protein